MHRRSAPIRVGLIGHGQIGRALHEAIARGEAGAVQLVAIMVRDASRREPFDDILVTDEPAAFLGSPLDVVVEVAGHDALRQHAAAVLNSGRDLVTVSVGALADAGLLAELTSVAQRTGRRILIPSGAIAGLDMISAAALAPLESVTHITRKPPRAFTAEQLGTDRLIAEPLLLFDGPARDGVARFPENVNVAAAVSLAGIGLDRTRLRVYADPTVQRNVHVVEVRGYFGSLSIRVENEPSENPKTGRIVALSVAKALRNLTAPIVLGA